ncbi:MAG: CSS-motif domain-containing protein, partial [Acetobacteraceae bacterium]|nr:CSS-motif domain-containing protein [Acetobacteraceae bacterium]
MRRNPTILLALIVGLAAIAAPIAISIYLAREQSLREQTLRAVSLANDVMRRTDKTLDQAYAAQRRLEQQGGADPCSTESIHLMATLAVSSEELQGVGYVAGNQLLCSSIGWPNAAIPVGVPDYLGVQG